MYESSQLRAPREWVELTTITDPNTPVVVRVQTTASGRPLYSMEIGMLRDGRMLRYIPVYTNQDGSVVPTDVATVTAMIRLAEEEIAVDAGRKAAAWATRQPQRRPRRDDGGNGNGRGRGRDERRGRDRRRDHDDEAQWR